MTKETIYRALAITKQTMARQKLLKQLWRIEQAEQDLLPNNGSSQPSIIGHAENVRQRVSVTT